MWRHLQFSLDDVNGKPVNKSLLISGAEYLSSISVLPKGKPITAYVSFSVDRSDDIKYEYIRIVFNDYNEKSKEVLFRHNELEANAQLHDESIWGDI